MTPDHKPRVLFYFLHLLGVGHVYRAKRLIEGFVREGIEVDVIYGGEQIGETFEAASIHYLPSIRAEDATYKRYLDADGELLGEAFMGKRKDNLLTQFAKLQPDLILIEAFPFGRRMVRHEIGAMLNAARARPAPPLVVSSVRDILQERKKPGRVEESLDWIEQYFDHVLAHSDPNLIKLEETFPAAAKIADKVSYTGFVVPSLKESNDIQPYDFIATAGGGGFGGPLMETVVELAGLDPFPGAIWCVATGPHMSPELVAQLRTKAPANLTIVERLDNLASHLAKAKISISQCGYNTAMDVLRVHQESDCRAVFVPYDVEGQSEQARRAGLLAKAGYAINVPQSMLTVDRLATAIGHAAELPKADHRIDFDGVKNAAKLVRSWIEKRAAS